MSSSAATVSVITESRIFPASRPAEERTAPLSILDATVANFTPTETVLAFNAPALKPEALRDALRHVLDAYPQWTGRLHCLPFDASARRHGRLTLTWGRADDPGVGFVEASCDIAVVDAVPAYSPTDDHAWDPSSFPAAQLVPQTPLAAPFAAGSNTASNPALLAQVTSFSCGGLAVGVRLAHPLADAHTLSHFLADWAAVARGLPPRPPGPLFEPALLDSRAKPAPPHAPALPFDRFDWWVSNADSPLPPHNPPAELQDGGPLDPAGTPMPWADWNLAAPVAHYVLRFHRDELRRLWQAATESAGGARISRLDALLGHLWARIIHARGQTDSTAVVTLNYALGVRPRVEPPLPDRFVGSPLVMAAATAPARDIATAGRAARLLRETVAAFAPPAVAGHLHELMLAQSPQRIWQAFLGRRHLLVTSWIHTRLYEVDFGTGTPRLAYATMPRMDGLVQVMEAPPEEDVQQLSEHWADSGVDVQVCLAVEAMDKLLLDTELRRYTGD